MCLKVHLSDSHSKLCEDTVRLAARAAQMQQDQQQLQWLVCVPVTLESCIRQNMHTWLLVVQQSEPNTSRLTAVKVEQEQLLPVECWSQHRFG